MEDGARGRKRAGLGISREKPSHRETGAGLSLGTRTQKGWSLTTHLSIKCEDREDTANACQCSSRDLQLK